MEIQKKYIEACFNIKLYFTVDFDPEKIHSWNIDGSVLSYKLTEDSEEEMVQAQIRVDEEASSGSGSVNDKPVNVIISDVPFFEDQGKEEDDEEEEDDETEDDAEEEETDDEDALVGYQMVMYLVPYYEGKIPKVNPKYKDVVTGVIDINKYSDYISSNGIIEITRPFYKELESNEESSLLVSFCRWAVKSDLPYHMILNTEDLEEESEDESEEEEEYEEV